MSWIKVTKPKQELFKSIPLCTVKIDTEADFRVFCNYAYHNQMVINYAISDPEDWKRVETITDCYAVINYVPKAGMGRYVRVDFVKWNHYTAKGLGEKFEIAHRNYEAVTNFVANFAPDMLFWLLYENFGSKL